jgi:hypothetical protein
MESSADHRKPDCGCGSKRILVGRYPYWPRTNGSFQNGQSHLLKRPHYETAASQEIRDPGGMGQRGRGVVCSNDELPLTTETPTFGQLVSRVDRDVKLKLIQGPWPFNRL